MGRGHWLKAIICLGKGSKQVKVHSTTEKPNGSNGKNISDQTESSSNDNGDFQTNPQVPGLSVEEAAAIRIQRAFRRFTARKRLHRFKGAARFHDLIKGQTVKKQTSTTLSLIHSWGKIQSQINDRRLYMVTEGRARQKKMENQLKLEAKLHELGVEWNGGSETMEEILSRIQQREEAAIKRERAMAYAFSHQWRANNTQYLGQAYYTLGKDNWGWSWKERWIAARPWEVRVHPQPRSAKREHSRQGSKADKVTKQLELKLPASVKQPYVANGKVASTKSKKLPNPNVESPNATTVAATSSGSRAEEASVT